MLDLNKLRQKHYEFVWFDGSVLQLRRPSQKLFEKLMEISELKETDLKGIMKMVYDILFEVLNGNLAGRKFTRKEIEDEFDLQLAYIFIEDYVQSVLPQLGE